MSSSVTDDVQSVSIVVIKLVCLLCYCCYLLELNMNPCFVYSHVSWTCYELINRMSDKNMLSLIAAQLIPTLFYNDAIRQAGPQDAKPDDIKILEKTSRSVEFRLVR